MKQSSVTAALLGAAVAALALALGEFVGIALGGLSLVAAVGDVVVDLAPGWFVRWMIGLLGAAQKPALLTGVVLLVLAVGAGTGIKARSAQGPVGAAYVVFGLVGVIAAARSGSALVGLVAASTAVMAGLFALRRGVGLLAVVPVEDGHSPFEDPRDKVASRRGFLTYASGMTLAAGVIGFGSRLVADRGTEQMRRQVAIPRVRRTVTDKPSPTSSTEVPWAPPPSLTPWTTPNDAFYRIDTALVVPKIDPDSWSLRIDGMVEREVEITLTDLFAMNVIDSAVTLACVSNEVGGQLVGNAVWTGVPLLDVLELAGPMELAEQVMAWSVDSFSAGFPLSALGGDRTALVAFGMNGEPLPFRHGFPARLVVAGLYGYVSAVKWLERIELTTMDSDGYWIPRGWAKEAPIKIASRIDVPLRSQTTQGSQAVAGVAWAPVDGVAAVELAIDDGPWAPCRLERGSGPGRDGEAWVQWFTVWDAEPGLHHLRVRAWDRNGLIQPPGPKHIAPDGAEGYHTRRVFVA
ncbi:MAG: molybdopterin-dependent oxidoreductase [Acidimicrobiales bacterium]|nr:molybdopterin-dependent oxidoreductase [Acidimicrobiales bacterium]